MNEFDLPRTWREKTKVTRIHSVVGFLINHHNVEVTPAQSDHFKPQEAPGVIVDTE